MYCNSARLFCHKHNHLTQNAITLGYNLYPRSQFINQRERERGGERERLRDWEIERERDYLPTNTSSSWKRNQGLSVSKQKSPYFTKSIWKKIWNQWVENLAFSCQVLRAPLLSLNKVCCACLRVYEDSIPSVALCVMWLASGCLPLFLSLSLSFFPNSCLSSLSCQGWLGNKFLVWLLNEQIRTL